MPLNNFKEYFLIELFFFFFKYTKTSEPWKVYNFVLYAEFLCIFSGFILNRDAVCHQASASVPPSADKLNYYNNNVHIIIRTKWSFLSWEFGFEFLSLFTEVEMGGDRWWLHRTEAWRREFSRWESTICHLYRNYLLLILQDCCCWC